MKKKIWYVAVITCILVATLVAGASADPRFGFRGGIWIGPGWGPWWWGPPAPLYPYPYYPPEPPVVIQQPPVIYQQPQQPPEQPYYWYYCPDPAGYYPYIKKCPKGWIKVIPAPPPE